MAIRWSSSSIEDANNWDLHAVVRGCSSTTTSTALDPFGSYPIDHFFVNEEFVGGGEDGSTFLPDLATTGNVLHELEELCKPFLLKSQQHPQEQVVADLQQTQEEPHQRVSQSPRLKRRKNQQKKVVCQVPADGLSSDMWAWRKYGQKPIKGSPYPRGYYRCSSSKGCLARKQVERSRTDPTMLIITYTAEHNHPIPTHRNSLAGSTRNKFPLPSRDCEQNFASNNIPSSSALSTLTMTSLSPTTTLTTPTEDELLMPKGGVEEENDGDEEEEGIAPIGEMMTKEDMVFMNSEKLGDDIDDEDFVNKFFSNVWQIEDNATEGGVRR